VVTRQEFRADTEDGEVGEKGWDDGTYTTWWTLFFIIIGDIT
jgi:hypothetical protein